MRQDQTETVDYGTRAGGDEDSKRQDRDESRRWMTGGGQQQQVTKEEARWGGEEVGIELNNSNYNLGDLASNLGLSSCLPPPALIAPSDR